MDYLERNVEEKHSTTFGLMTDISPELMDEIVDRMVKKHQAQKLYNRLYDELGYDFEAIENIVDLVEDWLPQEHETNSYKWNQCIHMMKEKLR